MNNHMDDQIRDVYNGGDFEYNPKNWEALRKRLDGDTGRKVSLLPFLYSWKTGVAACLVAALTLFLVWPSGQQPAQQIAQQEQTKPAPATVPIKVQPAPTIAAAPATSTPGTIPAPEKQPAARVSGTGNSNPVAATVLPPATQPVLPATKAPQQETRETPVQLPDTRTLADIKLPEAKAEKEQNISSYPYFPELPEIPQAPGNSLAVTGGFNRGASNFGFAFGLNGSTRISNRFSLEGDVAYIRNNTSSITDASDLQLNAMSYALADGTSKSTINKIELPDVSRISYLQFAPSVNYRVGKLQLGVGADVQQMIQEGSNENVIYLKDFDMKILPRTDVGYTGKVHYNINSKIRAGVQYREGLQSAIDQKYFNRRYFQFTFQFALLQK